MKNRIKIISLLFMLLIGTCITPQKSHAQNVSIGFQVFYDELSPYGTWVRSPEYGYVWIPDVAPGFSPYSTNGYWVLTNDGWTWVSDYAWGWAPFHYGRWYVDPNWGPIWVPDYEWGPGWVTWRRSGDFYGWAPIGPGVSITIAYGGGYELPYNQWTFVRGRDFGRRNINNYYVSRTNNITIINSSTVINNTRTDKSRNVTYNAGPERVEVEKRAGRIFNPAVIRESNKPGQRMTNNQLQIYRPEVRKDVSSERKPAPARVAEFKDVKTPAERGGKTPPQTPRQQPAQKPPQQQQKQRQEQPAKQQPTQKPPQQRQEQPAKQQPTQNPPQQRQEQPAKQQPMQKPPQQQQQQRQEQPAKQQPTQKPQQQQPQQQRQEQPAQQQPTQKPPQQQQQRQEQPAKQQPQQRPAQPPKQQPSQPQQSHPTNNGEKDKQSHDTRPPKNMGA